MKEGPPSEKARLRRGRSVTHESGIFILTSPAKKQTV